MKTLKQTYHIHAPVEKVWQALVDPKEIDAWGGGPVKMDEKVGTKFSLWGGEIHGKNIEVTPKKKLVQEWFGGKWDEPSIATFYLSMQAGKTSIDFLQTNIPDNEVEDIADGWKKYYLGPLKSFVEKK